MRILLVKDADRASEALAGCLRRHGHEVEMVGKVTDVLRRRALDMVLLDLGPPDLDGVEEVRRLRKRSNVPIIVLTARSGELDRVLCLQAGADDYVVKPFGIRELLARIEAVVRRASRSIGGAVERPAGEDRPAGRLVLDPRTRQAVLDGVKLKLTRKEFDLLRFLYDDYGAVRTREEIIDNVWDENWYGPTRTLDVHIAALRNKLGDNAWIENLRGVGFRLCEPSSAEDD